jgi:NAD+ diphosphatase
MGYLQLDSTASRHTGEIDMDVTFGWPPAYQSLHAEPQSDVGEAIWFVFRSGQLLVVHEPDGRIGVPRAPSANDLGIELTRSHYLGTMGNIHSYAAEAGSSGETLPNGLEWAPMRRLHGAIDSELYALAGRALQLIEWERTHRFCGVCGTETIRRASERARECPACKTVTYPKVTPVIMALVKRGRKILLARSPHFAPGMVSVLAGFVEPGETLEQCVRREVFEEVGLAVTNIRYIASQPWPFPHSLMVGFFAEADAGEIRIDPAEIAEAGWYDIDQLPKLPAKLSLARVLIEAAIREDRFGSTSQDS